ncbi:nucleotidyltransferase domain-containing protein [uncultured Desulfobulbus sp.]|uniref:nucleotidyltransferase domain-containing protein n=1 Tax=uncultured Desulfobulbus sp. TaxID=239745 RepID=UPI0029C93FB2|nr:nucleotidyltransferase domain-containing protein [uncultured Desulfobulbus sp.]
MDKSYVIECVRLFAEKARQNMDVRQVILFGSYARGTATDLSDIDVAVVTNTPVDDWLEASTSLFKLRRDINLSIEPVLIEPSSDRSGFLAEIQKTGELVYDCETL